MEVLENKLRKFVGTEIYHKIFPFPFLITDGVKYFCDEAEAYWFVSDIFSLKLLNKKLAPEPFWSIKLTINENKAHVEITDGNNNKLYKTKYEYTDCPTGTYRFYFTDNVLMLRSEY